MGQPVDTWTTLFTRRASIEPISGREYLSASGEASDVSTTIKLRFDKTVAQIKPYDRLKDESASPVVIYDVETVINSKEIDWEVTLMCRRL
jgi:SPP1 family predicted phage head-tail adaptor